MKKIYLLFLLLSCFQNLFGHAHHYHNVHNRKWHLTKNNKIIVGSFSMLKDGQVYISDKHQKQLVFPLKHLAKADQEFVVKQYEKIHPKKLVQLSANPIVHASQRQLNWKAVFVFVLAVFFVGILLLLLLPYKKVWVPLGLVCFLIFGFKAKSTKWSALLGGNTFLENAFAPFSNVLRTYADANYFYVESNGIPETHEMMRGISDKGWQQQVPIQQCYTGANAWPIPLNPQLATNPIPVDSIHFTRGAIAIAINGVPIFNVHTNTGVDSYIDGQLDNFGGHCGRADDYHYHIAPLHLYAQTSANMPIAIGLDGYAVYGALEPDGSSMTSLDENHGHFFNGVYHYHGTNAAPYMIAKMRGKVTEDSTHQLIPQAAAKGVRPALTPLRGALIQHCIPAPAKNGYTLIYTLNNNTDSIVYNWNNTGQYLFDFYQSGTVTHQTYKGNLPCKISTALNPNPMDLKQINLYPIPVINQLNIAIEEPLLLILTDLNGKELLKINAAVNPNYQLDMQEFPSGYYLLKMVNEKAQQFNKKICKF